MSIVTTARQRWFLTAAITNALYAALCIKKGHQLKADEKGGGNMDEIDVYWFFIECDNDNMKEFEQK